MDEAESIWRITSGAAHGFAWSLLGQADTQQAGAVDSCGIVPFAAAGGIDRIANGYLCSFRLASHGWELLRDRSSRHRTIPALGVRVRRPVCARVPGHFMSRKGAVHPLPGVPCQYRPRRAPTRTRRAFGRRGELASRPRTTVSGPSGSAAPLPGFDAPPVVEVALGVQFRPLLSLRPIELAALRERWRGRYPLVQEQPPLPPTIESPSGVPAVQFIIGPALQTRLCFLDDAQVELIQLQHDRLTVNWRQVGPDAEYPRYPYVRGVFEERFSDLRSYVEENQLGSLDVTQVEMIYVNAIEMEDDQLGYLDQVLRNWLPPIEHHLGDPEQARAALVFPVPQVGRPPVRMYVAADPAQRPDGRPAVFLTLTVRGAPTDERSEAALRFMDHAHEHVVRSFAELTPQAMHERWERRQ
ncbi:MAG: TIGR04255 family protein [Acidimicrobiales bacterium]